MDFASLGIYSDWPSLLLTSYFTSVLLSSEWENLTGNEMLHLAHL